LNYNTDERYIANIQGTDTGHFIELMAAPDGSFEVLNSRNDSSQKDPSQH
jgi:hypothetical protein